MKKLTTLLPALLAILCTRLAAAEPESSFGLAPSAAPQIPPTSSNLPLIPEIPQPAEKPGAPAARTADVPHGDKTSVAEDELKKRILLRQARVKAEREPDLQALKTKALAARTDFEQRKVFIEYYTGLIERMGKFEPGLKKEDLDELKRMYTGRFVQTRLAPTIDPAIARAKHN